MNFLPFVFCFRFLLLIAHGWSRRILFPSQQINVLGDFTRTLRIHYVTHVRLRYLQRNKQVDFPTVLQIVLLTLMPELILSLCFIFIFNAAFSALLPLTFLKLP